MPVRIYSNSLSGLTSIRVGKMELTTFFLIIKVSQSLNLELKKIIDAVIQINAYFCHPENLQLAIITGESSYILELGFRRILQTRKRVQDRVKGFRFR